MKTENKNGLQWVLACTMLSVFGVSAYADEAKRIFELAKTFSTEGPHYQFDVRLESGDFVAVGTVNPLADEGERLTLHAAADEAWTEDFLEELNQFEQESGEVMWCQGVMDDVESFRSVTQEGDTLIYELNMSVDQAKKEEKKFAKNVKSYVTLSATDGAVLEYRMHAPKPFRPVMVAKINRFDVSIDCDRAPDGRTFSKEMRANIEGRAMMKSFFEKQTRQISNLVELP